MEHITIGEIGVAVTFLVGLISGIAYLKKHLKSWITQSLSDQFAEIRGEIKGLRSRLAEVDMESCKNYLVTFLSDVEKGKEIDEIERERFWEQMEHYTRNGGNSYIKRKVEQLKKDGKL